MALKLTIRTVMGILFKFYDLVDLFRIKDMKSKKKHILVMYDWCFVRIEKSHGELEIG